MKVEVKTMAIRQKPRIQNEAVDAFIQGAPDAKSLANEPYDKGVPKGRKRQITLTIAPELLRRVDETAQRTGQTRAAIINMAIFHALEQGLFGK